MGIICFSETKEMNSEHQENGESREALNGGNTEGNQFIGIPLVGTPLVGIPLVGTPLVGTPLEVGTPLVVGTPPVGGTPLGVVGTPLGHNLGQQGHHSQRCHTRERGQHHQRRSGQSRPFGGRGSLGDHKRQSFGRPRREQCCGPHLR